MHHICQNYLKTLKSEKVFSALRSTGTTVFFCYKSAAGLICALGCRGRYRLGVLVGEDEEGGLSPSFAQILLTYLILSVYLERFNRPRVLVSRNISD